MKKCNARMAPDNEQQELAQKLAGWHPIRCELEYDHDGEHQGRNKFAVFTWWNQEKNPQSDKEKT